MIAKNIFSQQITSYSHFFYNPIIYNPAYTGTSGSPNLLLINHTQWTGFKGAPQYNILTFDCNLKNKNAGVGLNIGTDKKGMTSKLFASILYSYKIKINTKTHLLFGISGGVTNQKLNYTNAVVENINDPSLFLNNQSSTSFNSNIGLAFSHKNLSFGFSIPQIIGNKNQYKSTTNATVFYTINQYYLNSIKYKINISKEKNISVIPLALIKYSKNTPTQLDANVNFDFQNKYWIGATYKSKYAIGINIGVKLFNRVSIGYSYDYITSNLNKYTGLSHEILLNFKFIKIQKSEERIAKEEDEVLRKLKSQDLNKLIIERIYKKIDIILDADSPNPEEVSALMEEISSFLDSDANEEANDVLRKYYNSLKEISAGANVLVKGKLIFEKPNLNHEFLKPSIKVIDLGTKKIVATCKPSSKDGKYYIIVKPGRKYEIIAECEGFKKYSKIFSPDGSKESFEMSQEIILTQ
jgi:type IX secretion system PorP/SprF family membrane protein